MAMLHSVIPLLWLLFGVYWAISAAFAKRSVRGRTRWTHIAIRVGILVLLVIAISSSTLRHGVRFAQAYQASHALMAVIGTTLVVLGIALAVCARVTLGRNWGAPMSQRQDPELVTGGPYAYVRHPIYSGIILAMIGSAIGHNVAWALPLVLFSGYFIYSGRREEELMCALFPESYPAYMRRTYMVVPYLL
jgi:protein-S-isoprenylcysteine O-methyltransferase Ste14